MGVVTGGFMSEDSQPVSYPVGAIVNGHVWTGTAWVPAQVVPAQPPPRSVPLSEKFQRLGAVERWAIIIGGLVVAALGSLIVTAVMERLGL